MLDVVLLEVKPSRSCGLSSERKPTDRMEGRIDMAVSHVDVEAFCLAVGSPTGGTTD